MAKAYILTTRPLIVSLSTYRRLSLSHVDTGLATTSSRLHVPGWFPGCLSLFLPGMF